MQIILNIVLIHLVFVKEAIIAIKIFKIYEVRIKRNVIRLVSEILVLLHDEKSALLVITQKLKIKFVL